MAYLLTLLCAAFALCACSTQKKAHWSTVPDDGPDVPMSVIEESHRQTEADIAAHKAELAAQKAKK